MTGPDAPVQITVGFGPEYRAVAAGLYWDAFGRKLDHVIGPRRRGVGLVERRLDPTRAVAAFEGGELVGIAGFNLEGRAFATIRVRDIFREFGVLSGIRRAVWASILHRRVRPDEFLIDGIVVRADRRGRGIGATLMSRLFTLAQETDKRVVRLDVVDTNPAARHLYEQMGFVEVKRGRAPIIRRLIGFAAPTTMERRVDSSVGRGPGA